MSDIDLRKLTLRLKVVELIKLHISRRTLAEAAAYWRRLIRPN